MKKVGSLILLFSLFLVALGGCRQENSEYPSKPIRIIVPWGAGGGADISIRLLAQYAEKELQQKFVVSNVTGGSGTIGYTAIADAKNDGYTIGYFSSPDSNGKLLFPGISYAADSFTPIVQYAADPHIIVVSKKSGINSMQDLLRAAKDAPGELTFGLGGAWTSHDFLRAALEDRAGVQFRRMVFQGGAAAVNAVAGGNTVVAVPFVAEALAQISAGNVVPIAISSVERSEMAREIPTVQEAGLDFSHTMWRGVVGPAGMDPGQVQTLSAAFEKASQNPEYQREGEKAGVFSEFRNSEDFSSFYTENHEYYKKMIEKSR